LHAFCEDCETVLSFAGGPVITCGGKGDQAAGTAVTPAPAIIAKISFGTLTKPKELAAAF
jgi:hypothetical protein